MLFFCGVFADAQMSDTQTAKNAGSTGKVSRLQEPSTASALTDVLHPFVREWFFSKYPSFSAPQLFAVPQIHARKNILVSAPTGSGKTLTAFLSILNDLVTLADAGNLEDRVYAVYISPLKALNNDIFHNLQEPLAAIQAIAETHGKHIDIRVGVRTGDTPQKDRAKMLKTPPHILVTTPESLAIVLSSQKFKEMLSQLWWVVIDEIHALAENKRGVHLSLSLERLQQWSPFTRIGLSATVAPLEDVARYLVGAHRDCLLVDIHFLKERDMKVVSPVKDLINTSYEEIDEQSYEMIHSYIQSHKMTLIFTNTRAATERIVHQLRERYPELYYHQEDLDTQHQMQQNTVQNSDAKSEASDDGHMVSAADRSLIAAHHGSLSAEHRLRVEKQLRSGQLRAVVCSTSLELGIDIGDVDLVLLLNSPKSVARALQRIGRSGHNLSSVSKGRIIVTNRDDLVECSLLLKAALERHIDRIHIPQNCLDVLSQQIYGMAINKTWDLDEMYALLCQSYCYRHLSRKDFMAVIAYLAGEYTDLSMRYIYGKIWRQDNTIGRRSKMARVIYMTNIGTIPDTTSIKVKLGNAIIGTIDENFLESLKPGDVFVLGGHTYTFRYSKGTVATVSDASGRLPTVPSWISEMLPLSFDLSQEILRFRYLLEQQFLAKKSLKEIQQWVHEYLYVDAFAAHAIIRYCQEQFDYAKISHTKRLLLEVFHDEGRKVHYIFHALYGRRVNDVLARAIAYAIGKQQHRDVRMTVTDNGFSLQCEKSITPERAVALLKSDSLREVMELALDHSQVLLQRFRHCASRSLMILRSYKGNTKSVGQQTVSSMILLAAAKRLGPDFPILKEARREVLEDKMDIINAQHVISKIESGLLALERIDTYIPSPFAFKLVADGYTDILKLEEKQAFLQRMHQMVMAKISLEKGKKKDPSMALYKEPIPSPVDYEQEWQEEDDVASEYRLQLLSQLRGISHQISLEHELEWDTRRLIQGYHEGFSHTYLQWLDSLLSSPPAVWPQELLDFLKDIRGDVREER